MMKAALFAVTAVAVGGLACGGGNDSPCEPLHGVYLTEYVEVSGDCGRIRPTLDRYPDDNEGQSETSNITCEETFREASADGCHVEKEQECEGTTSDGRSVNLFITSSADRVGEGGEGIAEITGFVGSESCQSIYDITITKQ